jgi:ArsR family transcriptional regulator
MVFMFSMAIMEVYRDSFRKHLITHYSTTSKQIMEADQFFKALCDPTRLRMLVLLSREGELCVCELTHALDEIQPKISRHLAQLREITVVLDRRQGQWIYYRLNPDLPDWARTVLAATAEGVMAQSPYEKDRQTLLDMPNRPGSSCCA